MTELRSSILLLLFALCEIKGWKVNHLSNLRSRYSAPNMYYSRSRLYAMTDPLSVDVNSVLRKPIFLMNQVIDVLLFGSMRRKFHVALHLLAALVFAKVIVPIIVEGIARTFITVGSFLSRRKQDNLQNRKDYKVSEVNEVISLPTIESDPNAEHSVTFQEIVMHAISMDDKYINDRNHSDMDKLNDKGNVFLSKDGNTVDAIPDIARTHTGTRLKIIRTDLNSIQSPTILSNTHELNEQNEQNEDKIVHTEKERILHENRLHEIAGELAGEEELIRILGVQLHKLAEEAEVEGAAITVAAAVARARSLEEAHFLKAVADKVLQAHEETEEEQRQIAMSEGIIITPDDSVLSTDDMPIGSILIGKKSRKWNISTEKVGAVFFGFLVVSPIFMYILPHF